MIQKWKHIKWLFGPENSSFQEYNYAAVPIASVESRNSIKVYFSSRDEHNRANIGWILVDPTDSFKIIDHGKSFIPFGSSGTFDENGIMPNSLIKIGNQHYMYYQGWNIGHSVPFRNAIGLLVSKDNGLTFEKYSNGPILDRSIYDPCFVASCEVLNEDNGYKMWYLSCLDWTKQKNGLRHKYHIKYATSSDGIHWHRSGQVAIDFKNDLEYAISVPRVIKRTSEYEMWYSYRSSEQSPNYQIGYAISKDGKEWIRKDDMIQMGKRIHSLDDEMQCYPYIIYHDHEMFMLYNGNNYGKTGIGLAIRDD